MRKDFLILALKIIQEECKRHVFCDTCPISDEDGGCVLKYKTPAKLDIDQHLADDIDDLNL